MKVCQDVLNILQRIECKGPEAVITSRMGQLDREMYVRVDKVLQLAGGKWNRQRKAHVFAGDAGDALEQVILTGEILDAKQELGAFWTPHALADKMVRLARLGAGMTILEPSAGSGRIVEAASKVGAHVFAIEVEPTMAVNLKDRGVRCICRDFLSIESHEEKSFQVVLMNPPFAKQQDVKHITHAAKFVRKGGRLVAVASAGVTFRDDRATTAFRDLVDEHDGEITPLPAGTFKESGTGVNTVLVEMDF